MATATITVYIDTAGGKVAGDSTMWLSGVGWAKSWLDFLRDTNKPDGSVNWYPAASVPIFDAAGGTGHFDSKWMIFNLPSNDARLVITRGQTLTSDEKPTGSATGDGVGILLLPKWGSPDDAHTPEFHGPMSPSYPNWLVKGSQRQKWTKGAWRRSVIMGGNGVALTLGLQCQRVLFTGIDFWGVGFTPTPTFEWWNAWTSGNNAFSANVYHHWNICRFKPHHFGYGFAYFVYGGNPDTIGLHFPARFDRCVAYDLNASSAGRGPACIYNNRHGGSPAYNLDTVGAHVEAYWRGTPQDQTLVGVFYNSVATAPNRNNAADALALIYAWAGAGNIASDALTTVDGTIVIANQKMFSDLFANATNADAALATDRSDTTWCDFYPLEPGPLVANAGAASVATTGLSTDIVGTTFVNATNPTIGCVEKLSAQAADDSLAAITAALDRTADRIVLYARNAAGAGSGGAGSADQNPSPLGGVADGTILTGGIAAPPSDISAGAGSYAVAEDGSAVLLYGGHATLEDDNALPVLSGGRDWVLGNRGHRPTGTSDSGVYPANVAAVSNQPTHGWSQSICEDPTTGRIGWALSDGPATPTPSTANQWLFTYLPSTDTLDATIQQHTTIALSTSAGGDRGHGANDPAHRLSYETLFNPSNNVNVFKADWSQALGSIWSRIAGHNTLGAEMQATPLRKLFMAHGTNGYLVYAYYHTTTGALKFRVLDLDNIAGGFQDISSQITGISTVSSAASGFGTGSQTFTVGAGLSFKAGNNIIAWDPANGPGAGTPHFMAGTVTSYSGTTLIVNVIATGGAGALSVWNIAPNGVTSSPVVYRKRTSEVLIQLGECDVSIPAAAFVPTTGSGAATMTLYNQSMPAKLGRRAFMGAGIAGGVFDNVTNDVEFIGTNGVATPIMFSPAQGALPPPPPPATLESILNKHLHKVLSPIMRAQLAQP